MNRETVLLYSATEFKTDLIANLKTDQGFTMRLIDALSQSEFEFTDSGSFTYRIWNTFTRTLKIYCRTIDKAVIEEKKTHLQRFCAELHGVKDDYMIMELQIFVKPALDEILITTQEIIINKRIVIDREKDYIRSGGFASIFKVIDPETEYEYAFKIFDPSPFQGSDSEVMKKRFIREAQKLISYTHKNIVRAFDFGFLGDESAYIKLEYIDGNTIYDYIKDSQNSIDEKNLMAMEYISAMAYIHNKADTHRDISYSNVMITHDGQVKVLDFGFAKNIDDTSYDTCYQDILHKFNPPDTVYDVRTEIYCMGAVLFTIFTECDFHISKIAEIDAVDCGQKMIFAIRKCLENDPEDRFQSAIDLQAYLTDVKSPEDQQVQAEKRILVDSFSLHEFSEVIQGIRKIEFAEGSFPTMLTVYDWVESAIPVFLSTHRFLDNLNIVQLILKLPNARKVSYLKSAEQEIDKSVIEHIYEAFQQFTDSDRNQLIKALHTIIANKSEEMDDLPF